MIDGNDATEAIRSFLSLSKRYVMNATASVVEARMEPVQKAQTGQQTVLTGQYLYDTFMKPDAGESTKMQIVRSWVDNQYDVLQIAGACDGMVKKAAELDASKWDGPTNDKGVPIDEQGKKVRGVKEQSAMNMRTVIQTAYGAIKFARPELESLGYDDSTGYLAMRVLAKKALDEKRITWKGEAQKTDVDRANARLRKEQKAETDVLLDVMKQVPRNHDETLLAYNQRIAQLAEQGVEQARIEAEAKIVADLLEKLEKQHGTSRMIALAQAICERYDVSINLNESEATSEQETLDAMANVSEEAAAH